MKIYLPDISKPCYVVQSEGVIRAYENVPTHNTTISYRDYFIDGNYIYRDGVATFGQYTTIPICLPNSVLTSEIYYRQDFDKISIIFLILFIFIIYFPIKIFLKFWKRGRYN